MLKKSLIAAGVAAAMAIPMAASADVSLSAQLQAEVVHISGDNNNAGGSLNGNGLYITDAMHNRNVTSANYSRVDLRSSHDLGNGLEGYGHIGINLNMSTGTFNHAARELLVGLGGDFGKFQVGRMGTPFSTTGKDPFHGTFMQARGNGGMVDATGGLGNGSYLNRSLGYIGNFAPVSVYALAALDTTAEDPADPDTDTNGEHAYALRVNVDLNPVEVWVAYTGADEYEGGDDLTMWKIGAEWKSGPFRVMGQYEDVDNEAGGVDTDRAGKYMMLAGSYTMGANTFMLGFGQQDAENDGVDQQWIALGVRHAFNRQVQVHAGIRATERDATDTKENAVGAGMRVRF